MEINRNQYFLAGLIVLLLGLQIRAIESIVLNAKATTFLVERLKLNGEGDVASGAFMPAAGPPPLRTVRPPVWLGYAFISVGAVLVLHSLAMKRPGA